MLFPEAARVGGVVGKVLVGLRIATAGALLLASACAPGTSAELEGFDGVCFDKCDGISLDESSGPAMLDFDDLLTLSETPGRRDGARYVFDGAPGELEDRFNALVDTPFVSNAAFRDGARPHRPDHPDLGPTVRVMSWNIERGLELDAIRSALRSADDPDERQRFYSDRVTEHVLADAGAVAEVDEQLDALSGLDVVVLNEVDRYMKRTGYRDVVGEMADELDMNYAYATEFVEVDPMVLGTERFSREDFLTGDNRTGEVVDDGSIPEAELDARASEAREMTEVDPFQSRNLHGNAVLSRYPILSARAIPLQTVCWDWYAGERRGRQFVQRGIDRAVERGFLEKVVREVRHGGRTALVVDLYVPGLTPDGTTMERVEGHRRNVLTVVAVHIEARSSPACRAQQMREVASYIQGIENPVVLAGDLNSLGSDGRPTTVQRLLLARFGNPAWVARQVIGRFAPYSGWAFTTRDVINTFRLRDDPTGANLPFLLPNPERGVFDAIESTRFADGAYFDFRGDDDRTINGTSRTLANSNQRDSKGFKTTFALQRTFGFGDDLQLVGRWKID